MFNKQDGTQTCLVIILPGSHFNTKIGNLKQKFMVDFVFRCKHTCQT